MAGRRAAGLSLWCPGADWLAPDDTENALSYLPSRLWIIGLGNLGQAFSWLLACLPYENPREVELILQDYDRIASSNDSTSMLSFKPDIGHMKTRVVGKWLETRGFTTFSKNGALGHGPVALSMNRALRCAELIMPMRGLYSTKPDSISLWKSDSAVARKLFAALPYILFRPREPLATSGLNK